jgi:hypothetical protein
MSQRNVLQQFYRQHVTVSATLLAGMKSPQHFFGCGSKLKTIS